MGKGCDLRDVCKIYKRRYNSVDELRNQHNFCDTLKVPEEVYKCVFYMSNLVRVPKPEAPKKGIDSILEL